MYVSTFWISNSTHICLALLDSSDKLIQSCAFRAPPNYTNSEPPLLFPPHLYSESFRYTTPFRRIPETRFVTSIRNTLDVTEGRRSAQAEANSRKPPNFRISSLDFRRIRVAWATCNKKVQLEPLSFSLSVSSYRMILKLPGIIVMFLGFGVRFRVKVRVSKFGFEVCLSFSVIAWGRAHNL